MLSGPADYPEWIISLELFLRMTKVGMQRAWQILDGTYPMPTDATERQAWDDGNDFTLTTTRKNCEPNARSRIGTYESVKLAYDELKKAYFLLCSSSFSLQLTRIARTEFIAEHISILSQLPNDLSERNFYLDFQPQCPEWPLYLHPCPIAASQPLGVQEITLVQ